MTPAMRPNCRSSGAATEVAMVSGLAPGKPADTWMVGKSTWGKGATGSSVKPTMPASVRPTVKSVVATGRRMNGADRLMAGPPPASSRRRAP